MEELLIPGWEDDEYKAFVEKFKTKKTTDDCYTPVPVYDAVADWVAREYGLNREAFVRPFYPGGDYEHFEYPPGCVVVDNPPFSILSPIVRFYLRRGIAFFLFAPALTLLGGAGADCCAIACGVPVTYENGAVVPTSFLTSMEPDCRLRTAPELYQAVLAADKENTPPANLPRFTYPDNIITAAMAQRWCKYGVEYRLAKCDALPISSLDEQRSSGKSIYGNGYILGTRAAAERAAAERAAAERAAATIWSLSEKELQIVSYIDRRVEKLAQARGK